MSAWQDRVAIFGNSFGNLSALRRVLALAEERGVERIVGAGNLVGRGARPEECIETLLAHGVECCLGGAEAFLTGRVPAAQVSSPAALEALSWTQAALSREALRVLEGWPLELRLEAGVVLNSTAHRWVYLTPECPGDVIRSLSPADLVLSPSPERPCVFGPQGFERELPVDTTWQAPAAFRCVGVGSAGSFGGRLSGEGFLAILCEHRRTVEIVGFDAPLDEERALLARSGMTAETVRRLLPR